MPRRGTLDAPALATKWIVGINTSSRQEKTCWAVLYGIHGQHCQRNLAISLELHSSAHKDNTKRLHRYLISIHAVNQIVVVTLRTWVLYQKNLVLK